MGGSVEYKGHTIVVAVVGVVNSDRWQAIFSIHKPGVCGGDVCVHRSFDPEPYATRDEAEDAVYSAARAWIDEHCRLN
jgi:hypothetical protein